MWWVVGEGLSQFFFIFAFLYPNLVASIPPHTIPLFPPKLPSYLILHLVRFTKSNFLTQEKNRSVVTFPVKNLSLKDYYFPPAMDDTNGSSSSSASSSGAGGAPQPPSADSLPSLSAGQLKEVIARWGNEEHRRDLGGVCERPALVELASRACEWAAGALAAVAQVRATPSVC